MMLDDVTPHVAVVVQAISDGKVMATTLSDERGGYRLMNLKPGQYQVRCYTLNGYVYYKEGAGGRGNRVAWEQEKSDVLRVESGKTLKDINFRFAPFKKGTWRNYGAIDGLAGNMLYAIYCSSDGALWFGTHGVSRFDGREFVSFTPKDGLGRGNVYSINDDPDGVVWFGTVHDGVSRYDGRDFINFTTEDGLADNYVLAIHSDPDGVMWFGTHGGGVSRYDGKKFISFTTEDGLAHDCVHAIHRDPEAILRYFVQLMSM